MLRLVGPGWPRICGSEQAVDGGDRDDEPGCGRGFSDSWIGTSCCDRSLNLRRWS
jgi:hypothetical protein